MRDIACVRLQQLNTASVPQPSNQKKITNPVLTTKQFNLMGELSHLMRNIQHLDIFT